jgi:signal recognition particle subunit SRP54
VFDALSARLEQALAPLRGRGRLDERAVDATLSDVRMALLEADVDVGVVRGLVGRLRDALVGVDLAPGLDPAQHVVKAVDAELTRALGGGTTTLDLSGPAPSVVVLAGLQGAGKTTAAAKLAAELKRRGRNPMLVAADLQRPAAVEQLKVNAERVGAHVYAPVTEGDPVEVARESIGRARMTGCDTVIVDTAGRTDVDEALLAEARAVVEAVGGEGRTVRTLFVVDAMIGQAAVGVARAFADAVGCDGIVLTKLDGDARGGAALSVREVTGVPIVYASVGERLEDLEVFHPERMSSRILGMGDVLSLVERAEAAASEEEARAAEAALASGEFTLDDLLSQLQAVKRMGPLSGVLGMIPGMGKQLAGADLDERAIVRTEAIIRSMTPSERRDPKVLNGRRRKRIATGSGTAVSDVNRLVKQYEQMRQLMRTAARMAGQSGANPKGLKGARAQAAAMRQLQQQLGGAGGMGGAGGRPKRGRR